jgi:hypothetical protein
MELHPFQFGLQVYTVYYILVVPLSILYKKIVVPLRAALEEVQSGAHPSDEHPTTPSTVHLNDG